MVRDNPDLKIPTQPPSRKDDGNEGHTRGHPIIDDVVPPMVWSTDDKDFRAAINRSAKVRFFDTHPRLLMAWMGVLFLTVGVAKPDYLLNIIGHFMVKDL